MGAAVTWSGVCGCWDLCIAPWPQEHTLFFLRGLFPPSVLSTRTAALVSGFLFCFLVVIQRVALWHIFCTLVQTCSEDSLFKFPPELFCGVYQCTTCVPPKCSFLYCHSLTVRAGFLLIFILHAESWNTMRLGYKYYSNGVPSAEGFCRAFSLKWQLVCSKHMSYGFLLQARAEYFWKLDPKVYNLTGWK